MEVFTMLDNRYKELDGVLSGFKFGTLQSFKTLFLLMNRKGMDREEFAKYMKLKTEAMTVTDERPDSKRCPVCNDYMRPEFVNISAGTITDDDSTIVHSCINIDCMHQIFE